MTHPSDSFSMDLEFSHSPHSVTAQHAASSLTDTTTIASTPNLVVNTNDADSPGNATAQIADSLRADTATINLAPKLEIVTNDADSPNAITDVETSEFGTSTKERKPRGSTDCSSNDDVLIHAIFFLSPKISPIRSYVL